MTETEHFFFCPYCNEQISMLIDTSAGQVQSYIEDCEVCCRPIEIRVCCLDDVIESFDVTRS
jgi:Cysteine-rich CPXCG